MGSIRNWASFSRSRWDWTAFGYEEGFPRNCQFSDQDAEVEFDGHWLEIEALTYDGIGEFPTISTGQSIKLRKEASFGKTVIILYGCGVCNDPYGICVLGPMYKQDRLEDWRELPKPERRKLLKYEIDRAMGLTPDTRSDPPPLITIDGRSPLGIAASLRRQLPPDVLHAVSRLITNGY